MNLFSVFLFLLLPLTSFSFNIAESEIDLKTYFKFVPSKTFFLKQPLSVVSNHHLLEEISNCGISLLDNSCLDSTYEARNYYTSFKLPNLEGHRFAIKEIYRKNSSDGTFLQISNLVYKNGELKIKKVSYIKKSEGHNTENFNSLIERLHYGFISPIMEFNDFLTEELIIQEMEVSPSKISPKLIIHFLTELFKGENKELINENIEIIQSALNRLEGLESKEYITHLLEVLTLKFGEMNLLNEKIIHSWLNSNDLNIRLSVVFYLIKSGDMDDKLKPILKQVINTPYNRYRKKALKALSSFTLSKNDQNFIIKLTLDNDFQLSKIAMRIITDFKLDLINLEHLISVFNKTDNWKVQVLGLISNISEKESFLFLIDQISNLNPELSGYARKLIIKNFGNFTSQNISEKLLDIYSKAKLPHIKINSLMVISKSSTEKSTFILIRALKTRWFKNVRSFAQEEVMKRPLLPIHGNLLLDLTKKRRSRAKALSLLYKLSGKPYSKVLFKYLLKGNEEEVESVKFSLNKKKLDKFDFYYLKKHLSKRRIDPNVKNFLIDLKNRND